MILGKFHKSHRGFTLVELIVVVAIVAILGAIGIPSYMRRQTAARRSECTTMLSSLSTMQASYATQEGRTTSRIFCPRVDDGLHIVNDSTPPSTGDTINVLTMLEVEAERYCNRTTKGTFPPFAANLDKIAYQFRFLGGQFNRSSNPPYVSGPVFPSFANGGKNVHKYSHPGNLSGNIPNTTKGKLTIANSVETQFRVQCHGNVDDDAFTDTILVDHLGNTRIMSNDVNNKKD